MKFRKIISTILTVVIFVAQFSWLNFAIPSSVYALEAQGPSTTIATKYFYNQLTNDAKVFYNAMDQMFFENDYSKITEELNKPDTKFGVNSYDLTDEFDRPENASLKVKLEEYTKGNQDLLNTMGAARDAYAADHAGIFYLDFDAFSLRVTQDQQKKLHVSIGIGRTETYINKAFWDETNKKVNVEKLKTALNEVQTAKDAIVNEVKNVQLKAGQSLIEQQIRAAHDTIIKLNSYKLEEDIIEENKSIQREEDKGDPWNVRTVYGAFGPKHEIVCEGFGRALKMILDDLNIPCVLVYGAFVSANTYEEHLWNYVQLENGKWYAVDATWDNTDEMIDGGYDGDIERISTEYFLAGDDKMSLNHLVTGIMSVSNYEFKYPKLETTSDKYVVVAENAGLRVEIDDESYDAEEQIVASKFKVSYAVDLNGNGVIDSGERMGYHQAKEHGYYMVTKFTGYYVGDAFYGDEGEEGWGSQDYWGYVLEEYGSLKDFPDEDDPQNSHLEFYNSNSQFIQFGITTVPPMDPQDVKSPSDIEKATTYFGTSEDLVAMSDMIFNPNGTYVAAPYVKRATPVLNSTMHIGDTYHCTIEYDDVLIPTDGLENVGVKVGIRKSSNAERNKYTLTNFKFDGASTFEFDFTPSELYADDAIFYDISFTGVVGARSGKKPMETGYFCAHKCEAYAYKSQGFDWNVYGKPTLMDDVNLDNLTEEENSELSSLLKHRITLVTTTTKPSEEKTMEDLLNNEGTIDHTTGKKLDVGGTVADTETYNVTLTLCKKQKIQDGQAVRIMLGFPAGYGPEDAGVTFKAYHYIKDSYGNITGVEEIPCMVTELGLVIECTSFSPFTIATIIEDTSVEKPKEDSKTILFQSSDGGTIFIGEEVANKIKLDSKETTSKTITIKPDEGYVVDDIVIGEKIIDINGADELSRVSASDSDEVTYEIQYDELADEKYEALVAKVAFIPKTTKEAEKEEGLELISQPIVAQPSFTISTEVNKIVKDEEVETKESAESLNKDDEIEVTYKLDSMTAVGDKGIRGIGALLSYNKEVLEYKEDSLKGQNGWEVQFNPKDNIKNHNIVVTNSLNNAEAVSEISGTAHENILSNKSQQIGAIFTIRFTVKQDIDSIEAITLKSINGGTGTDINPTAPEVITNIQISKIVNSTEDTLTTTEQATCEINESLITNIDFGTTVAELEKQLSAGDNKLITYYGSKLTKDEEGNIVEQSSGALKTSVKLVGDDILSTGTIVKVGNKTWTIVVNGDLDGDGSLSVNDITLFKLNYIEEQALAGAYLEAAEVDGEVSDDGLTTINDLVRMILYYIGEEKTLKIKE